MEMTVPADPLYQHLLLTAERKFWCCVQNGEPPHLFGIDPPRPRLEAVRTVDMSGSNAWAEFANLYRLTRPAVLDHDRAKTELKALVPEDAREAAGHGVRAKRSKSGAISFELLAVERPVMQHSSARIGALAAAPHRLGAALTYARRYALFTLVGIAGEHAQSAVERELVLRLASLLWRLRRATTIESGLFKIQAKHLLQFRQSRQAHQGPPKIIDSAYRNAVATEEDIRRDQDEPISAPPVSVEPADQGEDLTRSFVRLSNLPTYPLDRLSSV